MPRSKKDTVRIIDTKPDITGGGSLRSQSVTVVPPPVGNIAKPTNLQAANGGIARSPVKPEAYINLTWRSPVGIVPTYYEIEYGRSSEWNNTTKTFSDPQRVISYNIAATISVGLKTFYRFRVRAVHRNVVSQWTDTVQIESEDDAVATAPVSSPAGTWDSLTGDLTITWTNPTDVNFRDVRLRIFNSSAQTTLYRTVFVSGQSYIYTRAQNISDSTGGDPSVYVILEARSWASSGTVYSTPVNLTTTLSTPANVTLVAGSPTFDFVTGSATWRWNAAARASYYRLTIDNITRDVYSTTYTYSVQQNASEHNGTADNVLSWNIVGVDAFGQVSTTATSDTATLNDPGTVQNVSATWNGATGECTWKWDPLANTTSYRLTIDNVARTVTGTSYTYTLDQNRAEHNTTADPTLSWNIVGVNGLGRVSPTAVTGTATLSPPAQPENLTLNFTAPDLVVNWTVSTSVVGYRMEVDNLSREIGYTNRYVYTLAQNRIEHSGAADATLNVELWAIDALGQISTSAATASATAPAPTQPDAVTLQVYFDVLTATVAHTRTVFTEFYQYRVTIGGTTTTDPSAITVLTDSSNILLDSSSPAQQLGYETGSNYNALIPQSIYSVAIITDGSYQVHVAEVDVFGRTSAETSSNIAIADALTLEELRAEAKYTDSLTPPTPDQQLKQVLADNNLTSPEVAYTVGSTYRWTQMSRALLERYRTITAGLFSPTNTQFYFATSIDGSNWRWFAGDLINVSAAGATLTEQPDQPAAASNAISASSASLTTRWDLPVIVEARFVRLYHRNTTSNYTIAEFYPRRLVQSDDIEAESIKAINIAAKTISAAQISARSITGDEIDVNTITVTNLNFTPVQTGNVVTSINASTEGIRIAGNRITIDGDVTFAASYDPSTKITTGGAAADVNANVTTISGGKITTGSITALQIQAGTITGDRISSATTITAGSDNSIAALNGSAGVVTDGTNDLIDENGALIRGNTWRIYAGNVDPNTAPFRVEADGTLFATNAVITTASAGIRMENDEIRFIEVAGGRFNRISFYESNNIVQIGEITATPAYVSGSTFFPQEIDIRSTYTLRLDAEDLWMTADNEVRLWSDNFIISAPVSIVTNNVSFSSGNGIDFSSNSGAIGMTSKVLVDYEEGNWTPTYTTTGTNFTSVTYAIRYGRYTKIGNMVTAWFVLSTSAMTIGSASGTVCVEGLPFTAANVLNASAAGSIARSVDFADDRPSAIAVQPNTKYANLYFRNTADGDTLVLAPADMATGFVANILEATISYCV